MASLLDAHGLSKRDRAVIALVAKFRQMTTGQIRKSLFADLASTTPLDRTLKRLVEQKHLSRLRRLIGGDEGGSGQFVYQLGRAGWKLLDKPGAYWAPRAVNLHTLAIADCYVILKRVEQRGELEVIQFITESDCHRTIGNILLTPDAYVEFGNRAEQVKYAYWVEVDRGTEHLEKIREKLIRYWRAYRMSQEEYFPTVLFVVPDLRRCRDVQRVMSDSPRDADALFECCQLADLVTITPPVG